MSVSRSSVGHVVPLCRHRFCFRSVSRRCVSVRMCEQRVVVQVQVHNSHSDFVLVMVRHESMCDEHCPCQQKDICRYAAFLFRLQR